MTLPVRHIALPFHEIDRIDLVEGETLHALIARSGWATQIKVRQRKVWSFRLPTVCSVNGKPALQTQWRKLRLRADDVVEFWSRPHGGGSTGSGKQVLGLVAIIALAAFAPWAGGAIAGALQIPGAASTIAGAITPGGSLLIRSLDAPSSQIRISQKLESKS